jgi:UDP-N-acetylglucosamine--N-acetylmuramyl-(pentapeptide) pyrophosphoryl-undecaprenol N-acetylglucosamine transferase
MKPLRIILSGGGTGGHIYPAIAIANELQDRYPEAEFLFVGAKDKMEMQKVPQAGYAIKGLWISGIQRKLSLDNLSFPFKLLSSLSASRKILKTFKPHVAIGTGGFASGPLLKMASMMQVPSLIQEQNSYAGITNKWLGKSVDKICVAYPDMQRYFPVSKIVYTGNPIRKEITCTSVSKSEALVKLGLNLQQPVLLVLGGSLGSKRINQEIAKSIEWLTQLGLQVLWQTGKLYFEKYKHLASQSVLVVPFIEEMNIAYAAADFIVSRAGAGAVSELSVVGKPTLFIPSPNVAEDHQTKNAQAVAQQKAALYINEKDLEVKFQEVLSHLVKDEQKQSELSFNFKQIAKPNAAAQIVDEIEQLIQKKYGELS